MSDKVSHVLITAKLQAEIRSRGESPRGTFRIDLAQSIGSISTGEYAGSDICVTASGEIKFDIVEGEKRTAVYFTLRELFGAALAARDKVRTEPDGDHFAYPDSLELRCAYGVVGCVLAEDEHERDAHDAPRHSQVGEARS